MSNARSSEPFKKLDCARRNFLRMPGNALKIWLYYYCAAHYDVVMGEAQALQGFLDSFD